ncbi:hypothetical protein CBW56_08825 [Denitratisoma oestradiolicum]|nr:hypothetical protein CBW56_08825 [Denitratisoma oestradiolicum]
MGWDGVNRLRRAAVLFLGMFFLTLLGIGSAQAQIAFRAAQNASMASAGASSITYVGSGGLATANSGNATPTLPAHAANDLLICLVESRDNVAHSVSGWTAFFSATLTNHRASIFYKIAGASESNPTVVHSGGSSIIARCSAFRGVDTVTPIDVAYGAQTTAGDDKINTGSITTATAGDMLLIAGMIDDNRNQGAGIAGWANAFFSTYDSANDNAIALYYLGQASAGATGPFQVDTDGNANSHGVLLALRPATVGMPGLAINRPAGTDTGDVMIAALVVTPSTVGLTAPAGWTLVRDTVHNASGGDAHLITYVKAVTAIGSEPASYTWTYSAAHSGSSGGIAAFSGADTANPVVTSAELKENNAILNQTAPSITASATDMLVTAHEYQSSGTWTPPAGMTEMVDEYSAASTGASGVSLSMNSLLLAASGATGTKIAVASGDSDEGASQSIALRQSLGVNCFTVAAGNWNDPAVWDDSCHGSSGFPLNGDTVTINSHTVTLNVSTSRVAGMVVNNGGTLSNTAGNTLNLGSTPSGTLSGNGVLSNSGTLALGTGSVILSTNYQFTGSAASTWTLNQLDLGGRSLTFGAADAYTIGFAAATPIQNVGSLNTTGTNSTVTFQFGGAAQALPVANVRYPKVVLAGSGAKTLSGAGTFDVRGSFTLDSGPTFNSGTHGVSLYGDFTNNGGSNFNSGGSDSSTWSFLGASIQNINSSGTDTVFPSLTLNNSNGIAMNAGTTVKTLLTLTNGYISTGNNILILTAYCNTPSWARTNGFVSGRLRFTFNTGTTTCTYPIGSSATYAPVGVTMVATAAGGTLTASTTGSEHPQIASSGIDATKDANRYWTLGATTDSTGNFTSYGATFNADTGDIDIGATTANFVIGKYTSSAWTLPTPVSGASWASGWAVGVSNVSVAGAGFGDFVMGEVPASCLPPTDISGLPAMTCVCDNFGRTALNPSTIYGQNWIVDNKNQSSTFGNPRIVNSGYLRLTDNSSQVATVANVPGTFPAAGNMIITEFRHYAYSGSNPGADGIALTLSDSGLTPTPGAFGGSLGYAQKSNPGSDCTTAGGCPGFNGGWMGIGIDEWGNFANATEGRQGGVGLTAQAVTLRGSGAGQTGYPYLSTSGALSPTIDNPTSTVASRGHKYRIVVDARNYTSGNRTALVQVQRDTGTGYVTLPNLNFPNIYSINASQADVPANWKLSFTGSTGAAINIHEIAGLKVCAQSYTPPAGFRIQVDNLSPSTCATAGGNPAAPIVTVTAIDSSGNTVTNYTQTVTLSATLFGGGASAAAWSVVSGQAQGSLVGNAYTFASADAGVAKFYLVDASSQDVYITVTESGGSPLTSLATPVQYRGGSFNVTVPDSLGSQAVAARPHLMRITRTTCGGGGATTDTSYIGAKTLDGWFSPVSGVHPAAAAAPLICTTNGSGTCLPAAGSSCSLALPNTATGLSATTNNLPTLNFASGVADVCLVTSDVGQYPISVRDDSNVSSPVTGSSINLTVRPFALYFHTAKKGGIANPLGGAKFLPAGDSFEATVAAVRWWAALDANYDGVPDVDKSPTAEPANWATAATSTTAAFAWLTSLSRDSIVSPVGGIGDLGYSGTSIAVGSWSGGQAVLASNSLNFDELGSFTAKPLASAYLGAGDVPWASDVVGRFYLDHFSLASGTVTAACNGFTYMDQPALGIAYRLEARNKNDIKTSNYAASLGYAVATPSLVAENGNDGVNLIGRISGIGTASWTAGVYEVASTGNAQFSRPGGATATWTVANGAGAFDMLALGIKAIDNDGAKISGVDMRADKTDALCTAPGTDSATDCDAKKIGAATRIRFGRLRLLDSYGSELLAQRVPVRAEYIASLSGAVPVFRLNDLDNCTSFNPHDVMALGNYAAPAGAATPLAAGNLDISHIATSLYDRTTGQATAGSKLAGGEAVIRVTAPTPAATGSVALALNLGASTSGASCVNPALPGSLAGASLGWLRSDWGCSGGAFGSDPNARITFGTPKSRFIYLRERY